MTARRFLLLVVTAFLVPSCSPGPPAAEAVVGKWREAAGGGREILEFSADGKVTTYYEDRDRREQEMVGTYSVLDGNELKMEFQGKEKVGQVSVGRDEMTLRLPPGNQATGYRRVR